MTGYLLFQVESLRYAIELEQVQRIEDVTMLTPSVGKDKACAGMMRLDERILDVYSFRAMIGKENYVEKVKTMFEELKHQHQEWIEALDEAVGCGCAFTKTIDPHACHLGRWIDTFSTNSEVVGELKRELNRHHQDLHKSAVGVLELRKHDVERAKQAVAHQVHGYYTQTISYLDQMAQHTHQVALDSQRLLIMKAEQGGLFGLIVDLIDGIIQVPEERIIRNSALLREGRYIKIIGALEHEKRLLSVIETITIPKGKA
ncbi:MAG: chemotaxis protein CheW [Campylobacterales bacterium]|nr:chemotaxis protein CheW [Campylobacterales bacterium]